VKSPLHILLLNPPLDEKERSGSLAKATARSVPYGLLSLAAVIRRAGYTVSFLDAANLAISLEDTVEKILAETPDIVGITTVTMSVDRCAEAARRLKARRSDLRIVAGGPHLSSVPEETMRRFPAFDIGVVGEGEDIVIDLIEALRTGRDLQTVKGILFRRDGRIVRNRRRPLIQNLDRLPMPAWDLAHDLTGCYRPSAPSYLRLPSTTLVTSRGCDGRCIFCNSRAIHGSLRCFSADYVLGMIAHLRDHYGIRDLSIYDDNFLRIPDRVEKICRTILDRKWDLTWSCYSRVDQGDYNLFRLMKKAGCWQVSYGIESGSQRILDFLRKDVTLEQIDCMIRETKRAGLRTRGFFMIGNILETEESIRETVEFLLRLPLDDFHFTTFTPLPGTHAYRIADDYGVFDKTWSRMNLQYPSFIPRGLTAELMEKYSRKTYRKFYFRPRIVASYFRVLLRHPSNVVRLWNGLQALVSRVFDREHRPVRSDGSAT